jgi:hypothetical protein
MGDKNTSHDELYGPSPASPIPLDVLESNGKGNKEAIEGLRKPRGIRLSRGTLSTTEGGIIMNRLFVFIAILIGILFGVLAFTAAAQEKLETDVIETSAGNLEITFIGHGTLMFIFGGKVLWR